MRYPVVFIEERLAHLKKCCQYKLQKSLLVIPNRIFFFFAQLIILFILWPIVFVGCRNCQPSSTAQPNSELDNPSSASHKQLGLRRPMDKLYPGLRCTIIVDNNQWCRDEPVIIQATVKDISDC